MIDAGQLHRLIQGSGHLRRAAPGVSHKEWLHFCVTGESLEVIANFSLMDGVARVALIVRTGKDQWHGDVELIPADLVRVERGTMNLDFGHNTLRFTERGFELSLALTDRPVTARLLLEPRTMPLLRPNTPLEGGSIHWVVVPRLIARGTVIVGRERFELQGAPAYHDHNWGRFAWGDDFAWQWGFGVPLSTAPAAPDEDALALAFVRLIDRARARDVGHGLFFWRGDRQQKIFREGELTVTPSGYLRKSAIHKFPAQMALLAPEQLTDVPAKVGILARGRGDEVEVVFSSEELFQVLIPNDRDLGVTVINEVSGRYSVRGILDGKAIEFEGRGFFEVLTQDRGRAAVPFKPARAPAARAAGLRGFRAFLRASLEALLRETPQIYEAMCAALESRVVCLAVGEESVTLGFSKTRAVECESLPANVSLSTDAKTVLALCDAEMTIAAAVRSDRLELTGGSPDLIAFDDGLAIYLAGAVRAPSFPGLLHDYRADVEREAR